MYGLQEERFPLTLLYTTFHLAPPQKWISTNANTLTFDCLNSASSTFETCNCRSASVILRAPTGSGAFKSAMAAATFSGVAGTCVVDILYKIVGKFD